MTNEPIQSGSIEAAVDINDSTKQSTDELAPSIYLKGAVEAALFITNQPLSIAALSELLNADHDLVEEAILDLMNDYAFREQSALEIADGDGYILQLKEPFQPVLNRMMPMELAVGPLKTLSAIAIKGPILQSDLVSMRGSGVYEHIPELLSKKLVTKKRQGRSYQLNVTRTFYEYFRLKGDKKELEVLMALIDEDIPRTQEEQMTREHSDDLFTDEVRTDVTAVDNGDAWESDPLQEPA